MIIKSNDRIHYLASPASGLNLHMDQNPFKKIGRHCVQGMIPFLDVTEDIGGLKLVPKSHSDEIQEQIRKERSIMQRILSSGDFVKVDDAKYDPEAIVVEAKAGDLILWDSRVIHGSQAGPGMLEGGGSAGGLARCSGLVCMTPRTKASQEVLGQRELGFQAGAGFSHWPHEAASTGLGNTDGRNISWSSGQHKPVELSPLQKAVL